MTSSAGEPSVLDAVRVPASTAGQSPSNSSWIIAAVIIAASSLAVAALLAAAVVVRSTWSLPAGSETGPTSGTAFLVDLSATTFARWINESESLFAYPGMLFFHTFGLAIVVGISIAVDLRLLGFATRIPLASMRALFRYLWLGFWINAVSGAMLFAADAPRKAQNPLFEIKLALVALGVMVTAFVYRHLLRVEREPRETSRTGPRLMAIASLLIWTAAIAAGRLIAYAL
jgi:hypothetical protein